MADRFEAARINIVQNVPLLLFDGEQKCLPSTISAESDFNLRGSFAVKADGFDAIGKLNVELKHIGNEEQVSLDITNPENIPFQFNFKNVEGIFQVTKDDDIVLSTRILIMDVNTCNNFDCTCDRKKLCYNIKSFCRVSEILKYIVEVEDGNAGVISNFACKISSYRKHESPQIGIQGLPAIPLNYTADILPDLLIKVSGKELPVHKAILAGQSDIFLAMFTTQSKKGIVEMKDSTLDGVKALLDFLYRRELQIPNKTNIEAFYDLLRISEKYNIQSLKEALVQIICLVPDEEFELEHAIQFLTFAQRLMSRILENKSFQIFQIRRSEIRNSKSVTIFFKENTELAEKLLTNCLN